MKDKKNIDVAYFSMEFAFNNEIPNYAGGLGILAADMMYSCADLGKKVVGISLIYHKFDEPEKAFPFRAFMQRCEQTVSVKIENRDVKIAIWKMEIKGAKGVVPIYFLNTYLPENEIWDRDLTKNLYASDGYTRLCQELILGIGGVRALEALGYDKVNCYHLNEGHCSFLTLELLRKNDYNEDAVRDLCTFTTHTPIPSGHDHFDYDLVYKTASDIIPWNIKELATSDSLNMTRLALNLSREANGVSQKHGEVCREMFPDHSVGSFTNGVYHSRWIGSHMKPLFDKYLVDWRQKPSILKSAPDILPDKALVKAKNLHKKELVEWINSDDAFYPLSDVTSKDYFSEDILTIGFARRFVPYKRPDMIFGDLEKLRKLGSGKLQIVFAGNCSPTDAFCNDIMKSIGRYASTLRGEIKIALIPYYNIDVSRRLVSGCDVWMNTPIPPQEASGTSGMKAALNGCLNLSILDGWWIEGFKKYPLSGWAFGHRAKRDTSRDEEDEMDLLLKLEDVIDCFYGNKKEWVKRMKNSIALLSFFNTHRVVQEYSKKMWMGSTKK